MTKYKKKLVVVEDQFVKLLQETDRLENIARGHRIKTYAHIKRQTYNEKEEKWDFLSSYEHRNLEEEANKAHPFDRTPYNLSVDMLFTYIDKHCTAPITIDITGREVGDDLKYRLSITSPQFQKGGNLLDYLRMKLVDPLGKLYNMKSFSLHPLSGPILEKTIGRLTIRDHRDVSETKFPYLELTAKPESPEIIVTRLGDEYVSERLSMRHFSRAIIEFTRLEEKGIAVIGKINMAGADDD